MSDGQDQQNISLVAATVFTAFLLTLDLVELVIVFYGADDFWVTDLLAYPITTLYLVWKKSRKTYLFVTGFFELIPYVGVLPFKTVGFLLTVWIHRRAVRRAAAEQAESLARQLASPAAGRPPTPPPGRPPAGARAAVPPATAAARVARVV